MRGIFATALLCLSSLAWGQEKGTYQPDSIYEAQGVKARRWYMGTNKKLGLTTHYDRAGRMIRYELAPFVEGTQKTTYYDYDEQGRLTHMIDTIRYGEPDKAQLEKLKELGLDVDKVIRKSPGRPAVETAKYKLEYNGDELVTITKYNPDGTVDYVEELEDKGMRTSRSLYSQGKVMRQTTTEYLTPFHKKQFSGWETFQGKKRKWNYHFEYEFENDQVKSYIRYEGKNPAETVRYFYNEAGLLIKMEGLHSEVFEYEFY